jgi:hypothetical protein
MQGTTRPAEHARTEFVMVTISPSTRPSPAQLAGEKESVTSKPGVRLHRTLTPPSPPGRADAGHDFRVS